MRLCSVRGSGDGSEGSDADDNDAALSRALAPFGLPLIPGVGDGVDGGSSLGVLLSVVGRVLSAEPGCLGGLLALQRRDVVDVEGAQLLLLRLACILSSGPAAWPPSEDPASTEPSASFVGVYTEGGMAAALAMVDALLLGAPEDNREKCGGTESGADGSPDAGAPFSLPPPPCRDDAEALGWCGGVAGVDRDPSPLPPSASSMARLSVAHALRLGPLRLAGLVANWLLALAACDASVMVTLAPAASESSQSQSQSTSTAGFLRQPSAKRSDGAESSGDSRSDSSSDSKSTGDGAGDATVRGVAYCVGVTDAGPKPAAKVCAKAAKEEAFCALAAAALLPKRL